MKFIKKNQNERMEMVEMWANYVRSHDDFDWSHQQNVIINSNLKSANISKEQYLKLKNISSD